jgi:hypothetical protein
MSRWREFTLTADAETSELPRRLLSGCPKTSTLAGRQWPRRTAPRSHRDEVEEAGVAACTFFGEAVDEENAKRAVLQAMVSNGRPSSQASGRTASCTATFGTRYDAGVHVNDAQVDLGVGYPAANTAAQARPPASLPFQRTPRGPVISSPADPLQNNLAHQTTYDLNYSRSFFALHPEGIPFQSVRRKPR